MERWRGDRKADETVHFNSDLANSMIGVIAPSGDELIVKEFFELWKTPWELYREDEEYEAVICTEDAMLDHVTAKLLIFYSGQKTAFDSKHQIPVQDKLRAASFTFQDRTVPIYGSSVTFAGEGDDPCVLTEKTSGRPLAYVLASDRQKIIRVGYDLFREVEWLLVKGQPAANASIPTLELHIAFLRYLIIGHGIPLVEIPPVPSGSEFIACLTHDLDHASIRRHKFDATALGFLYRATIGSAASTARGRMPLSSLIKNWAAAAKLPLVHLGLARDFWYEFDRYIDLEQGRPSTFFVVPFAGRPGRSPRGSAPRARGTGYDVSHIAEKLPRLLASSCEIGLHGIDAWSDSEMGRQEARRIGAFTGSDNLGVRMHWLYSDGDTPAVLDEAGFSYDSTVGYNETIGYRAGTSQVFKPMGARNLLELPMIVMDTALFFPHYLNLSDSEAWAVVAPAMGDAMRFGGALTVNWHDRSIAPERLWERFYIELLEELTSKGAWFSTAAQAVSWFRKRRSAIFQRSKENCPGLRVKITADDEGKTPSLILRRYEAQYPGYSRAAGSVQQVNYSDSIFDCCTDIQFSNQYNFR